MPEVSNDKANRCLWRTPSGDGIQQVSITCDEERRSLIEVHVDARSYKDKAVISTNPQYVGAATTAEEVNGSEYRQQLHR